MSYKLVRRETAEITSWFDTGIELSEDDVNQIEELYAGDIDAFLDNKKSIDETEAYYDGELVREKDLGGSVEWLIEEK